MDAFLDNYETDADKVVFLEDPSQVSPSFMEAVENQVTWHGIKLGQITEEICGDNSELFDLISLKAPAIDNEFSVSNSERKKNKTDKTLNDRA